MTKIYAKEINDYNLSLKQVIIEILKTDSMHYQRWFNKLQYVLMTEWYVTTQNNIEDPST